MYPIVFTEPGLGFGVHPSDGCISPGGFVAVARKASTART